VEIPFPALDRAEARVRDQLLGARRDLENELASPARGRLERSEAYGRAGMSFHAYGQRETAEACYRNAEQLAPDDFRWPYYLGHLYQASGETDRAVASFGRAVELRSRDVPARIHLAEAELLRNRADLAEPLFLSVTEIDPSCAAAHVGLGKIASSRRDFASAAAHFEAALRVDPQATEINYLLGIAYRNLGQLDRASERLALRGDGRATVADPLMQQVEDLTLGWRADLNRGISLYQRALYVEALDAFRHAAQAAPSDPIVRVNLGSTLVQLGDLAAATEELNEALEHDPGNAMAHFNLATILARGGDDTAAIEHYRAALESNPDYLNAHLNLGNALRRVGSFDEARAHYRRVVDGDPRNEAARVAEALSLIRLHRYREALERLDDAVRALPEARATRHALIRLLAAAPDDGVRDGQRALALASALVDEERSLPHVEALAMAAAETGDYASAVRWQQAGIDAANAAGRTDLLPVLGENLERYRSGRPCRVPWRDDDPILAPGEAGGP
jgi:tetratricopeptide (TPR) repeat protein